MKTKNKTCTRYFSNIHEESVAKVLGGRIQPSSGNGNFKKGDVITNSFLIECKTCIKDKESFSIKKEWLEKNKKEAFSQGLSNYCIAFNLGPDQPNYFIINEKLMKYLVEKIEEEV